MVFHRQTTAGEGAGEMMPNEAQSVETMIILGAGASAADGAPIQSQLFREYFKTFRSPSLSGAMHEWDQELAYFFRKFFGIDIKHDNLDAVEFPTFEEILGILEIAESQGESFRDLLGFHLIHNGTSQLRHIHDVLVFSIAEVLHKKLKQSHAIHDQLANALLRNDELGRTAFVSFNYDILIDNALAAICGAEWVNYGVKFVNQGFRENGSAVSLFKLHGSLNWLFCPTCRDLQITIGEKGVMRLKWEPENAVCERCRTPRSPIVIPPTFFKVLSNLHLRQIWDTAERACLQARQFVFCGYSFPDADVHVRYLLKRVEQLRGDTPEIFVVNNHKGKPLQAKKWEAERYRRFFVNKNRVHYTNVSFEQFAKNPQLIKNPRRWLS